MRYGLQLKKAVAASILVLVAVVAVVLGFLFLKSNSLVVPFMQPTQITVNQVPYTFIGDATGLVVYTGIAPTGSNSKTLTRLVVGETYPCLGINVKILEVHADRYVVSVTPNDAKPDANSDNSTIEFMGGSEQVEIRSITFNTGNTATLTVKNTGTSTVTIQEVWINNAANASATNPILPTPILANGQLSLTVPVTWVAGDNYQFKIVTAKGNPFMRNAIPPS